LVDNRTGQEYRISNPGKTKIKTEQTFREATIFEKS
jgi:hypothetical protein